MDTRESTSDFAAATAGFGWGLRAAAGVDESVSCGECPHREKCIPAALPARYAASRLMPVNVRLELSTGQTLCRQGDAAAGLHVVRSGALKSQAMSEDGRLQIIAIHLPGETLGAESIATGRRSGTVIALEDSAVCAISFAGLDRLTPEVPAVQHWFHRAMSAEMARSSETAMRLRCVTGEERIAGFLVDLSRRLSPTAAAMPEFKLSVCRGDIAFHLGLTRETVSRAFAKLQRMRLIDCSLTWVRLCDPARLGRLAACAAGPAAATRCA